MSTDFLDLDELYDVHRKQDHNRLRVYHEIYRKCLTKMKHTNNTLRRMECNFQVPSFVWGIPIYDYDELKEYILFRLHENGLTKCYFVDATTLYMSWKPEDIDKKKYQAAKKKSFGMANPTNSTMAPSSNNKDPISAITGGGDSSPISFPMSPVKPFGIENPYRKSDDRPRSTMMKFDDVYEVPVNLDKIKQMKAMASRPLIDRPGSVNERIPSKIISKTTPSISQPSRQLVDSWKNYFDKKK